eukprot:scaffold61877_cov30-Prasinocladus_malaysianus.AAC.2
MSQSSPQNLRNCTDFIPARDKMDSQNPGSTSADSHVSTALGPAQTPLHGMTPMVTPKRALHFATPSGKFWVENLAPSTCNEAVDSVFP